MKKINFEKPKKFKESTKNIDTDLFLRNKQISLLNQIYLNEKVDSQIILMRELDQKINSYKHQDREKSLEIDNLITSEQLVEKLVASKLKCYYCKHDILLLYKHQREEYQWSLDRIDNSQGHSNENTLISCLKCNLQRRCQISDAFKFTKQLKLKKMSN
tara:strand:- start:232 stop:708 length:477 start_codon:yes stop_codon:yes gene_type:complete